MHTENSILIQADAITIYRLAAPVERWPEILPHYRWVRVLAEEDNRRVVEMAARRGRFPVRWVAEQVCYPEEPRIAFKHVGGVTKGMYVEWLFASQPGGTQVRIVHDLLLGWPLIGAFAAERVIGPMFVANIAGRTLRRIKELAERQSVIPTGTRS